MEWQPIGTAPKDFTAVDVWADGERIIGARYCARRGKWLEFGNDPEAEGEDVFELENVTHWMPPPPPPTPVEV